MAENISRVPASEEVVRRLCPNPLSLVKMRVTTVLLAALVGLVALSVALASPVDSEEQSGGWKTFHAVKSLFRPVTDYFVKDLPSKSPSDVATDVREKVEDVKDWAKDNEAIQGLVSSLAPVKNWLQEKADVLKDKSFREMYDDVKERVTSLDEKVATWIQEVNAK